MKKKYFFSKENMGGLQPARTVHNGGYCNGFGYRNRSFDSE